MAAAVQTNLSVAFTHGAQLTMDHCGALIHGAAILWSCSPEPTAPGESPPRCALVGQPGDRGYPGTVAILFVFMVGTTLQTPAFFIYFGALGARTRCICKQHVGPWCVYLDTFMNSRVSGFCVLTETHRHAAAANLARQMECFLNPLRLFHTYNRERASEIICNERALSKF